MRKGKKGNEEGKEEVRNGKKAGMGKGRRERRTVDGDRKGKEEG